MKALHAWLQRPDPAQHPAGTEPRLTTAELVVLALVVLAARILAARAFPIYDDAFITYRYARNLASGLGMVYNPGAAWEPILGTTTPCYTVLMAGLAWLGLPMIGASLALNFACDALSAVLLALLLDRRRLPAVVAVLAFAAIPEIARISAGGMEPPVVVLAALLAVWCFQADRMLAAGFASAVACTLRPECVLLVLTLCVFALAQRRSLVRYLIPVALVGAVVGGTLTGIYGSPIPHSILAKSAISGGEQHPGYSRVPDILAQAYGPSQPMRLLAVVVALGAVVTFARRSRFLPFAVFATAVVVAYLIARPKTWGWYFYAPMLAWVGWLGLGCEQLARWTPLERLRWRDGPLARVCTLGACAVVLAAVGLFPRLHPDLVTPRVYERMAQWARESGMDARKVTINASDIGALGWYTNGLIYDCAGLIWPEALELQQQADQVRKYEPDYVVVVARRSRLEPLRLADPVLAARYRPVHRFSEVDQAGAERLEPDIAAMPDRWEQDYLVYERVGPRTAEHGK